MDEPEERSGPGERRELVVRLLLAGLIAVILVNVWLFVGSQRSDRRLRLRGGVADLEALANRSPSRAVRTRHATYYRLARELHGAVLHMDQRNAERHAWALEGLGEMEIRIARRPLIQISGKSARPMIDGATWNGRLESRKLSLLIDPAEREYVMAWVGKGEKARLLVVPIGRFRAANGKL